MFGKHDVSLADNTSNNRAVVAEAEISLVEDGELVIQELEPFELALMQGCGDPCPIC